MKTWIPIWPSSLSMTSPRYSGKSYWSCSATSIPTSILTNCCSYSHDVLKPSWSLKSVYFQPLDTMSLCMTWISDIQIYILPKKPIIFWSCQFESLPYSVAERATLFINFEDNKLFMKNQRKIYKGHTLITLKTASKVILETKKFHFWTSTKWGLPKILKNLKHCIFLRHTNLSPFI